MAALSDIIYNEEILSQILSRKTHTLDFTRTMGCFSAGSIPVIRIEALKKVDAFERKNLWRNPEVFSL